MPTVLRSRLLACAFAAFVLGCSATATAQARRDPKPIPAVRKPTLGERAAALAVKEVGVPYRWGGSSPSTGFDCSGLVYWAYSRLGVAVPHSSYALYATGRRIIPSRMKPGDVLVFSGLGHVGMYIGRGRMVHAPHSGTNVQIVSLRGSSYGGRVVGVRRIR